MPSFRELYKEIDQWGQRTHSILDGNSAEQILDDLHFHSLLRFADFAQFEESEGPYGVRLRKFLLNVSEHRDRAALLKLAEQICFVDSKQRDSLHREAFRKHIIPWLEDDILGKGTPILSTPQNHLSWLQATQFLSITESFDYPRFFQINSLDGIRKPIIIGELKKEISINSKCSHIIIQEDFVGTGGQAIRAIKKIIGSIPPNSKVLFCPSVILEGAISKTFQELSKLGIDLSCGFIVPEKIFVPKVPQKKEAAWQKQVRQVASKFAPNVLKTEIGQKLAFEEFGYGEKGALFATTHNVPNNSLPLIFRKTSTWFPLFRRREAIYDFRDETIRS